MSLWLEKTMTLVRPIVWQIAPLKLLGVTSPRWVCCLLWQAATAFVFIFAAVPALGQATQVGNQKPRLGSIHGTLTTTQEDTSSGLAGISVKLTTEPPDGNPMTADTDDAGHYEFKDLKPGTYTISITQAGFKPFTKSLSLSAGEAAVADIRVELQTVTEKVEVSEATQSIATEDVTAPSVELTQRQLISLPTAQEKIREVLPVTPGVVKTQDGKLNFKGADENQSLLLVNSARTTDPVTGSFTVPVPTDAVQSFAVYKTPYNAGLGSFSGGLTEVETKPPDDGWSYRLKSFIPSVLGKNGSMVGLQEATPGLDFSAPLLKHKLLFSEIFQYDMKKRTVRGLPWPFDISKKQGFSTFSTLEAIISKTHVVTLTVNAYPLRVQHADINALVPQPASNDLNQKGVTVGLTDRYQFSSGAIFSTVAQYTRFDSNAHGQGPADMLITPEGWGGNFFNQWSRRGKEFQLVSAYQFAEKHWFGHHELHVGVDFDHRSYVGGSSSNPVQILRQDGTLAEEITFLPAPLQNVSDSAVAEFIQDHWVVDSHWSVDLGARLSSETNGWPVAVAPRAGVAYSPGNEGKTVIRTSVGLFYSLLPLLAGDFAANPTQVITPFDTAGLPSGLPVTYTNAYVGALNPLMASSFPTQPGTTPRNFTWNVEVEQELRKNLLLRVGYIDSHTTYLFAVNPFTAAAGGQSFLALTNAGSSHYRELESTARFIFHRTDEIDVSYIRSRTRGDLNNLSAVLIPFEQPVIRSNGYGILPYDVPNRLVTWGIFSLPKNLKFSPIADLHSGYPYSNIDTLQNYVGTPNGQRFASFFTLDVKVYRQFRIPFLGSDHGKGKGHHVRLGFYSLNVTNHGNFNAVYNNVTAPNFGQFAGFLDRREGAVIDFID
jgi:Carboxypeptidase regulatory-like domain